MALQAQIAGHFAQAQRYGTLLLQQGQALDMRALLRLALWGAATAAALSVAVLAARTDVGSQRIAFAMTGRASQPDLQQRAINSQLAARTAETESEARRLADALRALTVDRDRLLTRLTLIERNVEDVTGSIKRQAATPTVSPTR